MKRQYDKKEITQLLNKFMAGETSLAEEQELAQYFRTHKVGEEWAEFKDMFTLFDNGEVDIELEAETSEHLDNGDSGKVRMLPKAVREKPKIVALKWLAAAAACALLLLIFHFGQNQVEKKPIVAEVPKVVERSTPQADSPSTVEEKKEELMAEVQPTPQPVRKQRKAVQKRSTQEKPMLAEAEPKQQSTEPSDDPDGQDTAPAFSSSMEDPFLLAETQAQNIHSRGERLHQEISMLMNNHLIQNN